MKNTALSIRDKLVQKYLDKEPEENKVKSTNINILLNRIKVKKKSESRKKLYFSAVASTGLILFGLIIF